MPGWREIGRFAVYERPPGGAYMPNVRMMEHWEPPVIKAICEHFQFDRMHMDPVVSKKAADDFKKEMVQNAIELKLPILTTGQPMTIGFLIVRPEGEAANIDLMGVHPEYRGRGIGSYLLNHFLWWADVYAVCRAGTMEVNLPACRMYENAGFTKVDSLRTFHER